MIAPLDPRRLARLRSPRAWAAICFGDTGLELASGRSTAGEVSILQQSTAAAPVDESSPQPKPQWQTAAETLRQRCDPQEHRVATSVGCQDVLCRTLQLPATDVGEIKQMLDLQIENLTPLPVEEVVYGFEPLEAADGPTRVLVAIARKAAVNERVEVLENAGLRPEIVSVDALAMFRALVRRHTLPQDERLNALVFLNGGAANVVVFCRGAPLQVRSIVRPADAAGKAEEESALGEDLRRTLVAAAAEMPEQAVGRVFFLAKDEAQKALARRIADGWSVPTEFLDDAAVPSPALSLCLQCAAVGDNQLNLLPDEWRQKRRAAALRRRLVRGGIALAALYVLAIAMFLSATALRRAQLRQLGAEMQSLRPQFNEARQLQSTLMAMRKQLDTTYSALEVLREISVRMPDNLKLNQFLYKKDQAVTLRGQAQSAEQTYEFIGRLEQCGLFSSVKTESVRTEGAGGLTKFQVLCSLKSAAEGAGLPGENQ